MSLVDIEIAEFLNSRLKSSFGGSLIDAEQRACIAGLEMRYNEIYQALYADLRWWPGRFYRAPAAFR